MRYLHLVLYVLSGSVFIAGLYRLIADGPNGELIAALTWVAACQLAVGGAVIHAIRRDRS